MPEREQRGVDFLHAAGYNGKIYPKAWKKSEGREESDAREIL